jgi:hypothetical protein
MISNNSRLIFVKQLLWRHCSIKVQVNFDIPIFEGHIDVDSLEKWLNMLEGYFSARNFFDRERSPLHSLRLSPM